MMAEAERELTEQWQRDWAAMYRQVEADINAQPAYQLRHWLQFGTVLGEEGGEPDTERLKLDRDALVRMRGQAILGRDPKTGRYLLPRGPMGV